MHLLCHAVETCDYLDPHVCAVPVARVMVELMHLESVWVRYSLHDPTLSLVWIALSVKGLYRIRQHRLGGFVHTNWNCASSSSQESTWLHAEP